MAAFERMANLATKAAVEGRPHCRIHAPLIQMTKAQIIRRGTNWASTTRLTHSCYDPDAAGRPCGHCDACLCGCGALPRPDSTDPVVYAAMRVAEIYRSVQGEGRLTGMPRPSCGPAVATAAAASAIRPTPAGSPRGTNRRG